MPQDGEDRAGKNKHNAQRNRVEDAGGGFGLVWQGRGGRRFDSASRSDDLLWFR